MNGVEVKYQPERTRCFLGSPSLVRLPDGALLASHDYFGPGCPRNHEAEEALLSLYRSADDGRGWQCLTHVMNAYWSTLFLHAGSLYLFGVSQQYGSIVIRRSVDGGFTWTHPRDERSGLLFPGGYYHDNPNYHCGPVPVCRHNGRIWRAFEDCRDARWGTGFQSLVVSAAEDADLLDASSWTMTNKLPFEPAWVPEEWGRLANPGWLEGNVIRAPDGTLKNILRLHSDPLADKAAILSISPDGRELAFEPATGFIDFPGGMTKFTIRHDAVLDRYLALVNNNTDPERASQRNVLSLSASTDLRHWEVVKTLIEDDSGLPRELSLRLTGFQYVDWQFDGEDLIYLVRTACRGARNFHDANRLTYHVLKDYRSCFGSVGGG